MKNEKTSKRVAGIAGRILALKSKPEFPVYVGMSQTTETFEIHQFCTVADLKALAASALTQTPDRLPIKKKVCKR